MEEKKESRIKKFWNDYSDIIISVTLVGIVYRVGYVRGFSAANVAVDSAFKALGDALEIGKI